MRNKYAKHRFKFEGNCADECDPMPQPKQEPSYQDPEGWLERRIQSLSMGPRLIITMVLIGAAVLLLGRLF